jgi:transposase-like protein
MDLIEVSRAFAEEDACLDFLEALRWPEGVRCLRCGGENISKITRKTKSKNKRTRLYQCLGCKGYQFSTTTGTIFADSHLPLSKWFLAIALMLNAKKSLSARQMQRDLGVGYQTAWYLCHRIRKAMEEGDLPKFTGVTETDETYVGGRYDKRRKRRPWEKQAVMGFAERNGRVEAYPIPVVSKTILVGKIKDRVSTEAEMVITDELAAYKSVAQTHRHEVINHIREWVRGMIHTNTIENFWSLFKRGVIGSFHKVSAKHLHRYLAEFTYRTNRRREGDIFVVTLARLLATTALSYDALVGNPVQ